MYDYAIRIIEKEIYIVTKCLSDWHLENYPDARQERNRKLKQLNNALKLLNNKNKKFLNNCNVCGHVDCICNTPLGFK